MSIARHVSTLTALRRSSSACTRLIDPQPSFSPHLTTHFPRAHFILLDMSTTSPTPSALVRAIFTAKGQYGLILGTVLGTSIWHSFISGPIAYGHLPRQQFGNLQSRLFPPFFALQSAASLALFGLWRRAGKLARSDATSWLLGGMSIASLLNLVIVGPWTTSIMFRRHRVERLEGTTYNAPDPSPKMKALNSKFAIAHSVSSILNLGFVFAVVAHTAWVAENGILA